MKKRITKFFILGIILLGFSGCKEPLNNPYRSSERGKNIIYSTFRAPPKHLDPAVSYSSGEQNIIGQIYEPPLQYHFLKRPYVLEPLTAESMTEPQYFDAEGNLLPKDVEPDKVARAVYEIKIKPGIRYQEHPCFAKDETGNFLYHNLTRKDVRHIYEVRDFAKTGTRELIAADYVYEIKRLAHPKLHCPILGIMSKYILGLEEYSKVLEDDLEKERVRRRAGQGIMYNQEVDERAHPIKLDLNKHPFPGVELVDRYTYRIILKTKYPQLLYWLAMLFFGPIPWETTGFYEQAVMIDKNITLDRFPVGTGAYRMDVYDPNLEIILVKNENYHPDFYPDEGEPGDKEKGLLDDAGKRLPFIEKIIYKLEKESIPRWSKFLQGYYDTSGIAEDTFDKAIELSPDSGPTLTQYLTGRNIRLTTALSLTTGYYGFNMLDEVVGGYTEKKCKLRQAINLAFDTEERIQIFSNGRGIAAQSPLPPGIFGYEPPEIDYNPYLYDWDERGQCLRRKSIEYARQLLAEAGYPNGRDRTDQTLVLYYDSSTGAAGETTMLNWLIKQFRKLGIHLVNRGTDYNRFREKMIAGNFQMFSWGWYADYPDPENLLFLLYGPNSKAIYHGENTANYDNPEYNRLFEKMRYMDNTPERLEIIHQMKRILQHDAPWFGVMNHIDYSLSHSWRGNDQPNLMVKNGLKYVKIEPDLREKYRVTRNQPVLWPVLTFIILLLVGSLPAVIIKRKKQMAKSVERRA